MSRSVLPQLLPCCRQRYLVRHRLLLVAAAFCLLIAVYVYIAVDPVKSAVKHQNHQSSGFSGDRSKGIAKRAKPSCVHPRLELWNENLTALFQPPAPLACHEVEENWIYVTNATFRVSRNAVRRHGNVTCQYVPIRRGNDDFQVLRGDPIVPMVDGASVTSDAFEISCTASDGQSYRNIHSAVAVDKKAINRSNKLLSRLPAASLNLSVIMIGFDSVSRMTWMRNLPKSYDYMINELGVVVLEGYNVVGDGTPQALLPILTGKTEPELPEARRGFSRARSVDGHPWIWKNLEDVGYVTQWAEDGSEIGTFTYRMLGFRQQPVDHYMRTYYLAATPKFSQHKSYCSGSVARHANMMHWMREFVDVYESRPKFSFIFHSEYSHGANNKLQWADDDLLRLLRYFEKRGHLDSSLLVLMSDHGARFQNLRATEQGKYEERLPFVGLRVPRWFADRYPEETRNLHSNAKRLTTPFDLHETFLDVIDLARERDSGAKKTGRFRRGFSLFEDIPVDRSCADADIEPHWCSCLAWTKVPVDSRDVQLVAQYVISVINNLTLPHESICARLSVDDVTAAVRYNAGADLLRFRQSADLHGRVADMTDNMNVTEVFYQVTLHAQPSDAIYEATVKHILPETGDNGDGKFVLDMRDISRINRYGSQADCIAAKLPHLRPYCFCHRNKQ